MHHEICKSWPCRGCLLTQVSRGPDPIPLLSLTSRNDAISKPHVLRLSSALARDQAEELAKKNCTWNILERPPDECLVLGPLNTPWLLKSTGRSHRAHHVFLFHSRQSRSPGLRGSPMSSTAGHELHRQPQRGANEEGPCSRACSRGPASAQVFMRAFFGGEVM